MASHRPTGLPATPAATTAASLGQAVVGMNRRSRVELRLVRVPVPISVSDLVAGKPHGVRVVAVGVRTAKGDDISRIIHGVRTTY